MWRVLRGIFFAALLSGSITGIAWTGLQLIKVLPLVWQAETFETAGEGHAHASGTATGSQEQHRHTHSATADDPSRLARTFLANILIGIGFSLLLCAAFTVKGGVDWRQGLLWGAMGYIAFTLAPALGLPPELPGMRGGEVTPRQVWWIGTALATAVGLALLCLSPKPVMRGLGAALLILPHLIGAPHAHVSTAGLVPAELAAAFVSATLAINLVFWILLGGASALMLNKLSPPSG